MNTKRNNKKTNVYWKEITLVVWSCTEDGWGKTTKKVMSRINKHDRWVKKVADVSWDSDLAE